MTLNLLHFTNKQTQHVTKDETVVPFYMAWRCSDCD